MTLSDAHAIILDLELVTTTSSEITKFSDLPLHVIYLLFSESAAYCRVLCITACKTSHRWGGLHVVMRSNQIELHAIYQCYDSMSAFHGIFPECRVLLKPTKDVSVIPCMYTKWAASVQSQHLGTFRNKKAVHTYVMIVILPNIQYMHIFCIICICTVYVYALYTSYTHDLSCMVAV